MFVSYQNLKWWTKQHPHFAMMNQPAGWAGFACTFRFSPATQESTGKPISIDHLWHPYFGWPNPIKPIQTPTFDDVHRKITHLILSPWNFPYIWVKSPSPRGYPCRFCQGFPMRRVLRCGPWVLVLPLRGSVVHHARPAWPTGLAELKGDGKWWESIWGWVKTLSPWWTPK